MKYTENQLNIIGANLANLWGAEFIDYEIEGDTYIFNCIEHGELFYTTLKEYQLQEYFY